jgi:hypothetical protein
MTSDKLIQSGLNNIVPSDPHPALLYRHQLTVGIIFSNRFAGSRFCGTKIDVIKQNCHKIHNSTMMLQLAIHHNNGIS